MISRGALFFLLVVAKAQAIFKDVFETVREDVRTDVLAPALDDYRRMIFSELGIEVDEVYKIIVESLPEDGQLWQFENRRLESIDFAPQVLNGDIRQERIVYRQKRRDVHTLESMQDKCTLRDSVDSFKIRIARSEQVSRLPPFEWDVLRIYVCPASEEDAPRAQDIHVQGRRGRPTLFELVASDAENFTLRTSYIEVDSEFLHGELFMHKCPTSDSERNELKLENKRSNTIFAPRGKLFLCYVSPMKDLLYEKNEVFQYMVQEYFEDGSKVLPDHWSLAWAKVNISIGESLEGSDLNLILLQGQNEWIIDLPAIDLVADAANRTLSVSIDSNELSAGVLTSLDGSITFSGTQHIYNANQVKFVRPHKSFFDTYDLESMQKVPGRMPLHFSYKVVADDEEANRRETSKAYEVSMRIVAQPQPTTGLEVPEALRFLDSNTFVAVAGNLALRPFLNDEQFHAVLKIQWRKRQISTSCEGSSFFRGHITRNISFPAHTFNFEPVIDVPLLDTLLLSENGTSWKPHPFCLEHGCSDMLWISGPRSSLNMLLESLEVASLCASAVTSLDLELFDPAASLDSTPAYSKSVSVSNSFDGNSDSHEEDSYDQSNGNSQKMPVYSKVSLSFLTIVILMRTGPAAYRKISGTGGARVMQVQAGGAVNERKHIWVLVKS